MTTIASRGVSCIVVQYVPDMLHFFLHYSAITHQETSSLIIYKMFSNLFKNFLFFQYVGEALIWVLATGLGDNFTPKLKRAWGDAYAIITDVMLGAIKDINGNS